METSTDTISYASIHDISNQEADEASNAAPDRAPIAGAESRADASPDAEAVRGALENPDRVPVAGAHESADDAANREPHVVQGRGRTIRVGLLPRRLQVRRGRGRLQQLERM